MNKQREQDLRFWLRATAERNRKERPTYDCFTPDHDPVEAEKVFTNKHGYAPVETFREFGLIWFGPVEKS